jgi:hypothetical protein
MLLGRGLSMQKTVQELEIIDVDAIEDPSGVAGQTELRRHAADSGQWRKKRRLDARRTKQARPKKSTTAGEVVCTEVRVKEQPTQVENGGLWGDPFSSLPGIALGRHVGETGILAHHCKSTTALLMPYLSQALKLTIGSLQITLFSYTPLRPLAIEDYGFHML